MDLREVQLLVKQLVELSGDVVGLDGHAYVSSAGSCSKVESQREGNSRDLASSAGH
jgi:hypothetical protein